MSTDDQVNGSAERAAAAVAPPEALKAPETAASADPEKESALEAAGSFNMNGLKLLKMLQEQGGEATEGQPVEETSPPAPTLPETPPATPAEAASFMDKISAQFDAAKARSGSALRAGLETGISFIASIAWKVREALGTLGKSISDGLASLFGSKKKSEGGSELTWGALTDEDETPGSSLPEKLAKSIEEAKNRTAIGERIVAMAELAVSNGQLNNAQHCWDWIQKVCENVGTKFGKTVFRTEAYGTPVGELKYEEIAQGDWLYVHNGNKSDSRGDHSVIFLGWSDEAVRTARVASFPGPGKKARIHTIDFNKTPITSINKPVLA